MSLSDSPDTVVYPRVVPSEPAVGADKVISTVLIATFSGGAVGGLIGFLMGVLIPNFYRSGMFGGDQAIDPVATGTGLGISEGLGLGFLLGVLIVCVLAFGKRKTH